MSKCAASGEVVRRRMKGAEVWGGEWVEDGRRMGRGRAEGGRRGVYDKLRSGTRPLSCRRRVGHGAAWRQGCGAGRPGPRAVLRDDAGGLRRRGGARGQAGLREPPQLPGSRQALAGAGPEAVSGSRGVAAHVRTRGRVAGALP